MKKIFTLLAILSLSILQLHAEKKIDVFLIGGQSNATGQGLVRNIPHSFKVDKSVLFYFSKYLKGSNEAETWGELCSASETKEKFGPELALGTSLKRYFPNRNIALIKHGLSGSNLYEQWNPGNRNGEKQGEEYTKWMTTVKTALAKLKEDGYTPVIRAMVWQQGEGDARDIAGMENSRRYGENLRNLILQIRKELAAPDMLFVYGKVMPMEAVRFPGRELVRHALVAVSEAACSPLSVKNAFIVDCDDLQMRRNDYKTQFPTDDVHLGTFGLLELGDRFATVIYNNSKTW